MAFYETKVEDLMQKGKTKLPCVDEKTDVATVLALLKTTDHVWVMDSAEPTQLIGVITTSDTIAFFSPPLTSELSFDTPDPRSLQFGVHVLAEEIMSKKPVTTTPEGTIKDILRKMKEQKIKHLPVLDDSDTLVGEVSLTLIIEEYIKHLPSSHRAEHLDTP